MQREKAVSIGVLTGMRGGGRRRPIPVSEWQRSLAPSDRRRPSRNSTLQNQHASITLLFDARFSGHCVASKISRRGMLVHPLAAKYRWVSEKAY
jgi:hypothetical protein